MNQEDLNKENVLKSLDAFHRDFKSDFRFCLEYYAQCIVDLINLFHYEKKNSFLQIDSINLNSVEDLNKLHIIFYSSVLHFENKYKVLRIYDKTGNFVKLVNC